MFKLTSALFTLSLWLNQAGIVSAQAEEPGSLRIPESTVEQFSITSLGVFVGAILSLLFLIAGVLVFVNIVFGGLQWILSGGDKAKTDAARGRIVAAITGLAIIALSYAVIILIENFFGIVIVSDFSDLPLPYLD